MKDKTVILLIGLALNAVLFNSCGKDNTVTNPSSNPVPSVPILVYPVNEAAGVPIPVAFQWMKSGNALNYTLQVAADSAFSSPIINDETLTDTTKIVNELDSTTLYFWRVKARNSSGSSNYSPVWKFTTGTSGAYFFEKDLLEFTGSYMGERHINFITSKRNKVSVEFTGETDAGTSNFIVYIKALNDSNSLSPETIFETTDQANLNKEQVIISNDISFLDPLILKFSVALTRPPSGNKFVRIKNIKVKETF